MKNMKICEIFLYIYCLKRRNACFNIFKVVGEDFDDVAHLFKYSIVVEETIGDALTIRALSLIVSWQMANTNHVNSDCSILFCFAFPSIAMTLTTQE